MAMFSKGRGLFGASMSRNGTPPIWGGPQSQSEIAPGASPDAAPIQQSATLPTYSAPKRTFLDKLGLVADAFQNTNQNAMALQAREQQDYQRWQMTAGDQLKRAQDFADWRQRKEYEAAHPGPEKDDAFTQTLRNAGIDPASPQGQELYRQRAYTQASPAPNFVSDGAGGGRWVTPPAPGMMGGGVPSAPVGRLTPLGAGGATPQGARSFPVR